MTVSRVTGSNYSQSEEKALRDIFPLIHTPFSSTTDILTAKLVIATAILAAIRDSQDREIPEYINFILKTPGFEILALPEEMTNQAGFVGKYVGAAHQLGIRIPNDEIKTNELIHDIIPHEFWHAYQTALRVKDHNPAAAFHAKSDAELAKSQAPFSNAAEKKELKYAISAGEQRIVQEYKQLRAKAAVNQLSKEEKIIVEQYDAAAIDYYPSRHRVHLAAVAAEKAEIIKEFQLGRLRVGYNAHTLYPDAYTEVKDGIVFDGYFVENPEKDRGQALIEDTQFRMTTLSRTYAQQTVAGDGDAELTYLTESDAYIAVNSKRLNETFYPERNRYHTRVLTQHLELHCLSCAPHFTLFQKRDAKDEKKEVEKITSTLNRISRHILSKEDMAWHFDTKQKCAWIQAPRAELDRIHHELQSRGIDVHSMRIANTTKEGTPTFKFSKIDYSKLKHIEDNLQPASVAEVIRNA